MYAIERRKVNDAIWYNPFSWYNYHIEFRRVWDMDVPVFSREEIALLVSDNGGPRSEWKRENILQQR